MSTWLWGIKYEKGEAFVVLQTIPTRYEFLSALVGRLYGAGVPGTFNLCNKLIKWLDAQTTFVYQFPITEQALEIIDPLWHETESGRDSDGI